MTIIVLVASTSSDIDILARMIAESVASRVDMNLFVKPEARRPADAVLRASEIDGVLGGIPSLTRCALVLVGRPSEAGEVAERLLVQHPDLVVVQVDVRGDNVRIGLRDPQLRSLLGALAELVDSIGDQHAERIKRVQLGAEERVEPAVANAAEPGVHRPLLQATYRWVHACGAA